MINHVRNAIAVLAGFVLAYNFYTQGALLFCCAMPYLYVDYCLVTKPQVEWHILQMKMSNLYALVIACVGGYLQYGVFINYIACMQLFVPSLHFPVALLLITPRVYFYHDRVLEIQGDQQLRDLAGGFVLLALSMVLVIWISMILPVNILFLTASLVLSYCFTSHWQYLLDLCTVGNLDTAFDVVALFFHLACELILPSYILFCATGQFGSYFNGLATGIFEAICEFCQDAPALFSGHSEMSDSNYNDSQINPCLKNQFNAIDACNYAVAVSAALFKSVIASFAIYDMPISQSLRHVLGIFMGVMTYAIEHSVYNDAVNAKDCVHDHSLKPFSEIAKYMSKGNYAGCR